MSTFRSEQLRQPLNLTGTFTGDLIGTASYATFAANGGGSVDTSSLLTTASFNNYTSSTTSQFAGTASFATTASFALNAGGAGFPFNGNAVITGSLLVSGSSGGFGGITGSLLGTASFSSTASYINPLIQDVSITGSLSVTGSSFSVVGGTTEFQVQSSGVKIGNAASDAHTVSGSMVIYTSTPSSRSLVIGRLDETTGAPISPGYWYFSNSNTESTGSRLEFVHRASSAPGRNGLYNTIIENFERRTSILVGQYQFIFSIGRTTDPYHISIIPENITAGGRSETRIGWPGSDFNIPPTSSGYVLAVTGSNTNGSFRVNDDIKVISSGIQISSSLAISASVFMPSLTTSPTALTNVLMISSSGQLFTTASSAIGGGSGTPAFPFNGRAVITGSLLVSGSSSGFSGITGSLQGTASWANNATNAISANTATTAGNGGVTSVSIFDGYPLSVNGITTGNVQIKTSYLQFSQIFNQNSGGGDITILSTPINNISEFTWSAQGTGVFALTADNGATPFTANKTMIQLNLGSVSNQPIYATHEYVSTSQIRIHIFDDTGSPVDDALIYANIDIKIFP
jgi:hypothetical protein